MKPLRTSLAVFLPFVLSLGFASTSNAQPRPPLPPLPDNPGGAQVVVPGPGGAPSSGGGSLSLERARRGVVSVERGGRPLAVGTVLAGDGRIVTALSALGGSDQADVRYADGTVAPAKVGHRDPAMDLALLIPQRGKWTEGLQASENDPASSDLKAFAGTALVATPYQARVEARAKDGAALPGTLIVDLKNAPSVGTPILDGTAGVVGVLVKACKPAEGAAKPGTPCVPVTVAAPIRAVRRFLSGTPATAVQPTPWLGIRGEPEAAANVKGIRVLAIAPGSPAEKGGLKAHLTRAKADLIFAVDGEPVETPEKISQIIASHMAGETVKLLVYNGERFREVSVVLRAAP